MTENGSVLLATGEHLGFASYGDERVVPGRATAGSTCRYGEHQCWSSPGTGIVLASPHPRKSELRAHPKCNRV